MKNNWEAKTIESKSLTHSYDHKYGVFSDYSSSQVLFFSDDEVQSNLYKALFAVGDTAKTVLSIGINNGMEINKIKEMSPLIKSESLVVGFDLSKSALDLAKSNIGNQSRNLIHGDISTGEGKNIETDKTYILGQDTFDVCLAFTSLSSSNLYLREDYEDVVKKIIATMKRRSSFIIIAPNCTIVDGSYKLGGTFLADKNRQDPHYAKSFIHDTELILKETQYETQVFGEKFIFLVAKRA